MRTPRKPKRKPEENNINPKSEKMTHDETLVSSFKKCKVFLSLSVPKGV